MSKFPSITPGINSQTGSAELRNQMLATFRNIDNRFLVTPGVIYSNIVGGTSSGATETTLLSIPIGSDYLAKNNSSILVFMAGAFGANANNKTIKVKFNTPSTANIINTIGPTAYNAIGWTAQFEIIRTGGSSQLEWIQFFPSGSATITGSTTASVNLLEGGTILVTGTGTASADVTLTYAKAYLMTT